MSERDRFDIARVTKLERVGCSVNGNPRYVITTEDDAYNTMSDASFVYGITNNGGPIGKIMKLRLTPQGRVWDMEEYERGSMGQHAHVIHRESPKSGEAEVKGYCPQCKRSCHKVWLRGSLLDLAGTDVKQHNRLFHSIDTCSHGWLVIDGQCHICYE